MKNKKGYFLTIIAILLVLLFFTIFQTSQFIADKDGRLLEQQKNDRINTFVRDLEISYIPDILTASSKNALTFFVQETNLSGPFASQQLFINATRDALYNGTYNQTINDSLVNRSLLYFLNEFTSSVAQTYRSDLMIEVIPESISLYHVEPFILAVQADFNYNLSTDTATWSEKLLTITTNFSIDGLLDPYYIMWTGENRRIRQSNYTELNEWNMLRLNETINQNRYAAHVNESPSYLQRFYNDTIADSFGIESFIIPEDLGMSTILNVSHVDHKYFVGQVVCSQSTNANGNMDLRNISGINITGFRLDRTAITRYLNSSANEDSNDPAEGGLTSTVCEYN